MKVNDYVRSSWGTISRIKKYEPDEDGTGFSILIKNECFGTHYKNKSQFDNDYKTSPNIIDLIEYGDIVKYKIDDEEFISEVWGEKNNYFVQNFDVPIDLRDLNIVSIVTKEKFSQMEYRIGE